MTGAAYMQVLFNHSLMMMVLVQRRLLLHSCMHVICRCLQTGLCCGYANTHQQCPCRYFIFALPELSNWLEHVELYTDLCRSDAESDLLMSMLRERAPKLHSMWLSFDEEQDIRSLPRSLLTLELCPDFDIQLDELDLTEGLSGMIALTHLKFGSALKEQWLAESSRDAFSGSAVG